MVTIQEDKDKAAVDISNLVTTKGDYICPVGCGFPLLPVHLNLADNPEFQCPECGYMLNIYQQQAKHASTITPAVTEEMITDGEEFIFETAKDDSGFGDKGEDDDEDNPILADDRRDEEMWRKKGYRVDGIS